MLECAPRCGSQPSAVSGIIPFGPFRRGNSGLGTNLKEGEVAAQAIDYQTVFDTLPSPHMLLDRRLCYVAVNAAYEVVTMRRGDELLGRNLFDMFPNEGEGGRLLRASLDRVFDTGESDTLAYIAYDIPRPKERGGGMEKRYWTAVHTPIFGVDGTVDFVMQNTVDVTEMVSLRQAASQPFRIGATRLLERAREAEEQHRAVLAESTEFRRLFELAPGFFAILSGPAHTFTFANEAYARLVGGREVIGKTIDEALPEVRSQGFVELLDTVYRTGEPYRGEATRIVLNQAGEDTPREVFVDFSYDAIRNAEGRVTGIFVQGMDRTEAVKTQQRQQLLLAELNHRVKNTLASVQSIVSQTLRSTGDADRARSDIESRLAALSKAHNLLSAEEWTSADMGQIVRQEMEAFDIERVDIGGDRRLLGPKSSIAIAMLVHEMATNATKYGALSAPNGRVRVAWHNEPDGGLTMTWRETGGPAAVAPKRRGFGTRLIEGIVSGELGGHYQPDYAADGFRCTMRFDARALKGGRP